MCVCADQPCNCGRLRFRANKSLAFHQLRTIHDLNMCLRLLHYEQFRIRNIIHLYCDHGKTFMFLDLGLARAGISVPGTLRFHTARQNRSSDGLVRSAARIVSPAHILTNYVFRCGFPRLVTFSKWLMCFRALVLCSKATRMLYSA